MIIGGGGGSGDKVVVLPLMGGGKVAVPIVTPSIGNKCATLPLKGGGKVATRLWTPSAGDSVIVIPTRGGGKVVIPFSTYSPKLMLIPVSISYNAIDVERYSWHAFSNFQCYLPDLSLISKISLINGYTITGDVSVSDPDEHGNIILSGTSDTVNDYVSLTNIYFDDIAWVYNNQTELGYELYAGSGYDSSIYWQVLEATPDITALFDLNPSTGDTEVSLTVHCSDKFEYALTAYMTHLAVEFVHAGSSFVKYTENTYGWFGSKKYGFSGPEI